jgi:hypothetical protein
MTTANSLVTAFIQDNPQYASTAGGSSTDPISQDFQALATAVSGNQTGAAQTAWANVKNDLAKDGVNLSTTATTAEAIAQNKATMDQEILGDLFGGSSASSAGTPSLASLLGGSTDSSGTAGVSSSLLNDWATYNQGGTITPASAIIPPVLDTTA